MDDSISDDINIVSSDEDGDADLFPLNDQHRSEDSQADLEVSVVIDTDEDEDDDVEVVNILVDVDGPAQNGGGHGSPGNDEVVVVDENIINLMEDSDDQQTSEDEDSEGQEEEDEEINVEDDGEGNAQPSSVTMPAEPRSPPSPPQPQAASPAHHLHPATLRHVGESEFMTSGHSQHAAPSSSSPSPAHHLHPATLRHVGESEFMTSGHSQHAAPSSSSPSRHTNSSPAAGSSVWQYEPSPGPSSLSHTHNSSMDDFQVPLMGGLSVLSSLAAARSSQSLTENFQPCKRRRIMSPVKASDLIDRKSSPQGTAAVQNDEDDDDGNRCSICFELWDNSGRHRLASLKCGHLFGLGCIEKWLKGQGGKCPSCNEKAKVKDIRVIYAKAIKMVDTTERDRALDELGREREMRRQVELEAAQARLQCQQYTEESGRLRAQVAMLREQLDTSRSAKGEGLSQSQTSHSVASNSQELQGQFVHHKTVRICESGQCRVLAHCTSMAVLVISQPSPNNLFPGFGIKKLSCMDLKTSSYLTLHHKAIRGLSFHQRMDDGLLLSVSMDKTIKLTSVITNTIVQTYKATLPVWSCEWNADVAHSFYVGQQNGAVLEFDTRSMGGPVMELNQGASKAPVASLQYLAADPHAHFKPGGLIVGQLDRVSFFESKGEENRLHILPLEGNLTSLKVDTRTRHMLASFRPSAKHPSVRHQLCVLRSAGMERSSAVSCSVLETFYGGRSQSVLSRTQLMTHPAHDSRLLVVAGDQPSESTQVWDTGTSQLLQHLPCEGVPVDFAPFTYNTHSFLAALTDKCLKVHQWNSLPPPLYTERST